MNLRDMTHQLIRYTATPIPTPGRCVLRYWTKQGSGPAQNPDIAAHYLSDKPGWMGDPAPLPSTVLRYLIPEAESGPKTGNNAAQYLSDVLVSEHPTLKHELRGMPHQLIRYTATPIPAPEDVCCDIERNRPQSRLKTQISQHSARRATPTPPTKSAPSPGCVMGHPRLRRRKAGG